MKFTKVKPMDDKVIVEMLPEADVTEGGIVIPDIARMKDQPLATVIAVGPGRVQANGERVKPLCEVGETVLLFATGVDMEVGDKKYNLVDATHIMAVVE